MRINAGKNAPWRSAVLTTLALLMLLAASLFSNRAPRAWASLVAKASGREFRMLGWFDGLAELGQAAGYYEALLNAGERAASNNGMVNRIPMSAVGKAAPSLPQFYQPHEFRAYEFRPNVQAREGGPSATNSFGMADREYPLEKPPSTRRLALIGDSVARGFGVLPDETFKRLLEDRMNNSPAGDQHETLEILNFAVGGYRLTQLVDVALEKAPVLHPDVYLVALTQLFEQWPEHVRYLMSSGIDPKYPFVRKVIRDSRAAKYDDPDVFYDKLRPFHAQVVRGALEEMKAHAVRNGASLVLLFVPTVNDISSQRARFHIVSEAAQELAVPTVDLLDAFSDVGDLESLRVQAGDLHPNAKGHRLIFENLWRKLQRQPDTRRVLFGAMDVRSDF